MPTPPDVKAWIDAEWRGMARTSRVHRRYLRYIHRRTLRNLGPVAWLLARWFNTEFDCGPYLN